MIGTKAAAARALARLLPVFSDHGSARIVYRAGNVIYKVERPSEVGSNTAEWNHYLSIDPAMLPPHIRMPEMSIYDFDGKTVIAAEFINGSQVGECFELEDNGSCDCPKDMCLSLNAAEDIRGSVDITDLAIGNVILSNGIYYVVDLEL